VPLVLRQIPIWKNDIIEGFVDLALERAFIYREHAESEVVPVEGDNAERKKEARFTMLEKLADHDDQLMEQLLDDIEPPRDKVFDDLVKELREGLICPVLIGSATRTNGVLRLHEGTAPRSPWRGGDRRAPRCEESGKDAVAYVDEVRAHYPCRQDVDLPRAHWRNGRRRDTHGFQGGILARCGNFQGAGCGHRQARSRPRRAKPWRSSKLDPIATGETVTTAKSAPASLADITPTPPVMAVAIAARERKDDVKLGAALTKLTDEDPSITVIHNAETGDVVLKGQGEMHLRVAVERLQGRYGVAISTHAPRVGYRETIRKGMTQRGRHKKQTGGHGQFGDVVLDIKPLPRGSGFSSRAPSRAASSRSNMCPRWNTACAIISRPARSVFPSSMWR
jgi:elongation factor G